jgi:hypothetical protein
MLSGSGVPGAACPIRSTSPFRCAAKHSNVASCTDITQLARDGGRARAKDTVERLHAPPPLVAPGMVMMWA